jgi:hypothetical protein
MQFEHPLDLATKLVLLGAGGLAVIAGPVLYLLPGETATYFAWKIAHPLTPVYMGAAYCAGVGNFWALAANRWMVARVQMPAIIIFAITQLIATLLHLSIFNWAHPIAWAWLAVYVISPVAAGAVWVANERRTRAPAGSSTLPAFIAPLLLALAVVQLTLGLALFLVPALIAPFWPWSLTPLTARVIGGWYISGAALLWMLARQSGFAAIRIGLLATTIVVGLLLIGALVHWADFNGPALSIALYLLFELLLGASAAYSWRRAAQAQAHTPSRATA